MCIHVCVCVCVCFVCASVRLSVIVWSEHEYDPLINHIAGTCSSTDKTRRSWHIHRLVGLPTLIGPTRLDGCWGVFSAHTSWCTTLYSIRPNQQRQWARSHGLLPTAAERRWEYVDRLHFNLMFVLFKFVFILLFCYLSLIISESLSHAVLTLFGLSPLITPHRCKSLRLRTTTCGPTILPQFNPFSPTAHSTCTACLARVMPVGQARRRQCAGQRAWK